jgi:hypothetical protein
VGTSKAPIAWTSSAFAAGGFHSSGRGLKLSFRERDDASEFRLAWWS